MSPASLPISAYAPLTLLLPMKPFALPSTSWPFPIYLPTTHPCFLYHSEGKKILGTLRLTLSTSTRCLGPSSTVTDTSSEHLASLLTARPEVMSPLGPAAEKLPIYGVLAEH